MLYTIKTTWSQDNVSFLAHLDGAYEYGNRLNIKHEDVFVEEVYQDGVVLDSDEFPGIYEEIELEIFNQIDEQKGDYYSLFAEKVYENGLEELCLSGKY